MISRAQDMKRILREIFIYIKIYLQTYIYYLNLKIIYNK